MTVAASDSDIVNPKVLNNLRIVSPLWGDIVDKEEEASIDQTDSQFTAASSPNKYLEVSFNSADQDTNAGFTAVLTKSQKKMRKKATQAAQSERYCDTPLFY